MGAFSNDYIHRSIVQFDTGLKLGNLMTRIYIPLDIFRICLIMKLESWVPSWQKDAEIARLKALLEHR